MLLPKGLEGLGREFWLRYSTAQSQMGQGVRCQEHHYVEALPSWKNSMASLTSSEINGFHCLPGSPEVVWHERFVKVSRGC